MKDFLNHMSSNIDKEFSKSWDESSHIKPRKLKKKNNKKQKKKKKKE